MVLVLWTVLFKWTKEIEKKGERRISQGRPLEIATLPNPAFLSREQTHRAAVLMVFKQWKAFDVLVLSCVKPWFILHLLIECKRPLMYFWNAENSLRITQSSLKNRLALIDWIVVQDLYWKLGFSSLHARKGSAIHKFIQIVSEKYFPQRGKRTCSRTCDLKWLRICNLNFKWLFSSACAQFTYVLFSLLAELSPFNYAMSLINC